MSAIGLKSEIMNSILKDANTEVIKSAIAASNDSTMTSTAAVADSAIIEAKTQSEFSKKAYEFLKWVLPPVFGIALFLALWTIVSHLSKVLPGPIATFYSGVELFAHPFYINNLNDQGYWLEYYCIPQTCGTGVWFSCSCGHSIRLSNWSF